MNKRFFGMFPVPETYDPILLGQQPFQGTRKKSPVKSKPVGCGRCGARGVTLRWNRTKTRKVCPKCYERGNG